MSVLSPPSLPSSLGLVALLAFMCGGCGAGDTSEDESASPQANDPRSGWGFERDQGNSSAEETGSTAEPERQERTVELLVRNPDVDLLPGQAEGDDSPVVVGDSPQPPTVDTGEDCVSNKTFFVEHIWTPILASDCIACHNTLGQASQSKFILSDSYQTGFLDQNLNTFEKMASYSQNGVPTLLVKPLGGDGHGGGARFPDGGPEYLAMAEMLDRIANPVPCDEVATESLLKGVEVLDWEPTLRKAVMLLSSRLPTADEIEDVTNLGEIGLDFALAQVLDEPAFFRWLKEVYNEVFKTDAYAEGSDAIDILSANDFPQKEWHLTCDASMFPNCAIPEFAENATRYTNWSVSQDTLELVVHVVRNNLPFTDILMADYIMVNPYSAKTYGATNVYFNNPLDPTEFRPAELVLAGGAEGTPSPYPHAGVMTSPMWLHRFPTTDSNVNRHRARMVYSQFLATDALKLAERPVDQATITAHNPTLNEMACATCHVVMDPVAGAFQNWNDKGRYRPPEDGWHPELRPPGFGEEDIGPEDTLQSLQWLAARLAGDHRFVISTVHTLFKALTGIAPISPPTDPDAPDYSLQLSVYLQQDQYFKEVGDVFVDSNYNLKSVLFALVKSPYFRAQQAQDNLEELVQDPSFNPTAHAISLEQLGTSRLLTPEELDRKLQVLTGVDWVDPETEQPYLLSTYRKYYGGIHFAESSERITEMNGTMANIAERMANEVSCLAVPRDFTRAPEARQLFPFVEFDYAPTEAHGFAVPEMDELIRLNILHLHERLLNELIDTDSPEFQRTYELFVTVLDKGAEMLGNGLSTDALPMPCHVMAEEVELEGFADGLTSDPNYTVRAWMAVVSYLLSDYRFLYH